MLNEALFTSWLEKEKRAFFARKRRYPHFDPKINFNKNISFFKSYFSNPKAIAEHAFYPFIRMELITPRYKNTLKFKNGKAVRKIEKKRRPLAYCAHFDAFIYSWFSTLLTKEYEKKIVSWGIYNNVLAYIEKGKSNIEFAHEVFEYIREKGECVALAFDISSFFDGLDHEHLKKMWCKVIDEKKLPDDHYNVYKSLTKYSFVEKTDLENEFPFLINNREKKLPIIKICEPNEFRTRVRGKKLIKNNTFKIDLVDSPRFGKICGIPQGSPISACLSNIYMIEFDIIINKILDKSGLYRRYCDDIIVVVDSNNAQQIKDTIMEKIKLFHLNINESKTEITYFNLDNSDTLRGFDAKNKLKNLQYLGFEFNGNDTYIRSSSMSRYYRRMTARIRENLKAAYGKKSIGDKVFKKKLNNRYTDKGKRNFISYASRAMEYMESESIHKQYKNSLKKVKNKYVKKKVQFENKRKPVIIMK